MYRISRCVKPFERIVRKLDADVLCLSFGYIDSLETKKRFLLALFIVWAADISLYVLFTLFLSDITHRNSENSLFSFAQLGLTEFCLSVGETGIT